jgi:hypothetical protein
MAYIIDRIIKGVDALAQLLGPEKVIRLEGNNVNIRSLLAQKYIVRAPKIRFVLRGP